MRGEKRGIRVGIGGLLACAALVLPTGAAAQSVTYTGESKGVNGVTTKLTVIVDFRKGEPVKVTRYFLPTVGECPGGVPWPFETSGPTVSGGVRVTKGGAFTDTSDNGRPTGSRTAQTVKGTISPNGKRITGTVSGTLPVGGVQCVAKSVPFKVEK